MTIYHPHISLSVSLSKTAIGAHTPTELFRMLRDKPGAKLLLESANYRDTKGAPQKENSFSYICSEPIAELLLEGDDFFRMDRGKRSMLPKAPVAEHLNSFINSFQRDKTTPSTPPGVVNGIFGYTSYDAIEKIEDIDLKDSSDALGTLPVIRYGVFRYVIVFDHAADQIYLITNRTADEQTPPQSLESLLATPLTPLRPFKRTGIESSKLSDIDHAQLIVRCKEHISRGDVFQIVPSRRFSQKFSGDEFVVYQALRALNPSPYLFFYDYDNYRIFGSSPEAQIVVKEGKATIFPIAGTCPRSGDDATDSAAVQRLLDDPKENAEHVMLVDLARNDLSIHCFPVVVDKFREVQLYSHVIHLVSQVTGTLMEGSKAINVLTATFPAGTLSGAPKHKAMQLIDLYEPERRYFYGGALGFIGFDNSINHAIVIRSFVSCRETLHFQAGSGVVFDSVPSVEVAEVQHKLGALRAALQRAEEEVV